MEGLGGLGGGWGLEEGAWGPYGMGTAGSPCFRVPGGDGRHCGAPHEFDWGFVVAAYA